jgi:hypothetical protein
MTKQSGGATGNQGGASKADARDTAAEFPIDGSVARKGEEPSPGKRVRGETTSAEPGSAVDFDLAHDRAS